MFSLASRVYGGAKEGAEAKTPSGTVSTSTAHAGTPSVLVWKDMRKGRSKLKEQQLTCECCGFWLTGSKC